MLSGILGAAYTRIHERSLRDRGWVRSLAASLVVAGLSGAILVAFRRANPGNGAEHYYLRENQRTAYRIMLACNAVILASIAFNLRFVVFEVIGAAAPPSLTTMLLPSKKKK
jgi:hypothetical protein